MIDYGSMKGRKERSRLQILEKLPTPYEGITLEIFAECLFDPDTFRKKVLKKMKQENGVLFEWVVNSSIGSLNPEETLRWLLSYYEIFSRSGEKEGQGMLVISQNILHSIYAPQIREIKKISMVGGEEEKSGC